MPMYGYSCKACEKEYEVFYTSQDAVKKEEKAEKCPACGSTKKRKLVSTGTTHIFKSGKWFKQGY